MLIVAVCLLDLERLREWWKSIGIREIDAVADQYEFRLKAYSMLNFCQPSMVRIVSW